MHAFAHTNQIFKWWSTCAFARTDNHLKFWLVCANARIDQKCSRVYITVTQSNCVIDDLLSVAVSLDVVLDSQ